MFSCSALVVADTDLSVVSGEWVLQGKGITCRYDGYCKTCRCVINPA